MKAFLVLTFVTVACGFHNIAKNDPELIKIAEDCGNETSVDITVFEPEKQTDMMKLFEDKKYQCFAKCFTEKAGIINDKGEPIKDNIKKRFEIDDDHMVFKVIDECYGKVKNDDMCGKIYEIEKCIIETLH